ncbi:alginate export family protein [Flavobacterium sp. LT1R49]|uniref:alginate export family protein n=1 Tax=Flavobacterium arabinosi TaxID=3398737 RepID=UPI003A83ACEC
MKKLLTIICFIGFNAVFFAQNNAAIKSFRYDDNFTYLKNDTSKNWYTQMKFIPLNASKENYISAGGEVRYQYFYYKNERWGDIPNDKDGYILTRFLLHIDIHASKSFRAFFQLQSSNANGRINPNLIENNPLDYHQAFFDINISNKNESKLIFRGGRQEMSYGSQRLVSVRELPNSRLSFDGLKLIFNTTNLNTDLFYSHPVVNSIGIFDNHFNKDSKFWGSYTVLNSVPFLNNIDFYYLGLWKRNSIFDDGAGKETRHSLGTRVWKNSGNWHYDFEGVYQFGNLENQTIRGWTISSNTTYQFKKNKYVPTVGLKSEYISGDKNYEDERIETFNPLYPRGAYFGIVGLIGPSNLIDIHPSINLEFSSKLNFALDYDIFWRASINDGIYNPNQRLIYSGKNSFKKFIGTQLSNEIIYQTSNQFAFKCGATWFNSGSFIKDSGAGKDIFFGSTTIQYKF